MIFDGVFKEVEYTMKKINFIGGFLIGALGSIWTLFIFVVGIILGIVLDVGGNYVDKQVHNPYPRYRK